MPLPDSVYGSLERHLLGLDEVGQHERGRAAKEKMNASVFPIPAN